MSLRLKLFLPLFLLTALVGGYLRLIWLPAFIAEDRTLRVEHSLSHLHTLGEALTPALLENNLADLHGTLSRVLAGNQPWVQLKLRDRQQRQLYPLGDQLDFDEQRHLPLINPVTYGAASLGELELWLDKRLMFHREQQLVRQLTLGMLATFGLFLVILMMIVEWFVRRPVQRLMSASDRLATGDYGVSLPKAGRDEIGSLVRSFDAMRRAVAVSQAAAELEISERRQAQSALEDTTGKLVSILESTTDAYMAMDRRWRLEYVNNRATTLLGIDLDQSKGMVLWEELPEFASFFYKRLKKAQTEQLPVNYEGYYPPLDRWLEIYAYPMAEGMTLFLRDITERVEANQALRDSETRHRAALCNMADGLLTVNADGIIDALNPAALQMFGYEADMVKGLSVLNLIPHLRLPTDVSSHAKYLPRELTGGMLPELSELSAYRSDGSEFPVDVSLGEMRLDDTMHLVLTVRDITARKAAEQDLQLAERVFESSLEGVIITDPDNRVLRVNDAFTRITGYSQEEIVGKKPDILASGKHDRRFYQAMWRSLEQDGSWQGEIWNRRKNSEVFPEYLSISVVRDANGQVSNYVAVFADVTEKKKAEARIQHMANFDPLTELANRTLFNDRLNHALAHAERTGERLAVMYLDLDRFKYINDTLGHPIGDEIIKTVAERLVETLREDDTVSRLGGDEFILLLPGIGEGRHAATVASKLLKAMALPYRVAETEIFVTGSIGIAVYPEDGRTRDDLIKNADSALNHAKEKGRDSFQFYAQAMNASALERFSMESGLRRALERKEFVLFYQPQVDLVTGDVVGAEALIRWQHAELGLVPPGQFIPLLEETGLIVPVGAWVMREACHQAVAWRGRGHGELRISVNISPQQFKRGALVDEVSTALQESGLDAASLELEITESSLMDDVEESIAILQRLKAMGVQLAIDDFGTGFSSLSYLKRFPIDVLKIDQSFVRDVTSDPEDAAITAAVIALGHSLELKVIAEGVESSPQLRFLRERRCDLMQGYLISRPLLDGEFSSFMSARNPVEGAEALVTD